MDPGRAKSPRDDLTEYTAERAPAFSAVFEPLFFGLGGSDHAKTRDVDRDKRDRLCASSTQKRSRRAREAIAFRALETRRFLMLASNRAALRTRADVRGRRDRRR